MALFAKPKRGIDPVEQAERALADARATHAKLADRLSAAETTVAERRAVGERLALGSARDDELDTAEAETRAAEDRVKTLSAALAQLDAQVAEGERALADARENRDRQIVAKHLEGMAKAIAEAYPAYDEAGFKLAQAIAEAQAQFIETQQLAHFLHNTRSEIAAACNLLDGELRSRAAEVRGGTEKFKLHRLGAVDTPREGDAALPAA
jgi:chromosome segregation ATPase